MLFFSNNVESVICCVTISVKLTKKPNLYECLIDDNHYIIS